MTNGSTFVYDNNAVRLELLDMFLGLISRGLDDFDAAIDDGSTILGVRRRVDRGQDGEIDAERPARPGAAPFDLAPKIIRSGLGQRGDYAESARIRYRRRQFGSTDPHHAALHDRMFDPHQFRKPGCE